MFDSYKDIFDKRGASYHQAMQTWPHARDQEFDAILSRAALKPGEIVCDIPSGGGYLRGYIPADQHLISIETTAPFFEALEVGPHDEKHLCEEIENLPLADASVDVVLSLAGLHHIDDKRDVFAEIYRVLKPGGRAIIGDVAVGSITAGWLNVFIHEHNEMGHEGVFLDQGTRTDLTSAGFEIVADESAHYHWCYDNPDEPAQYAELLFGIDQGSQAEIKEGIAHHLGTEVIDDKICMNWTLDFISCLKR